MPRKRPGPSAERYVHDQLETRTLKSLDDCRLAWERAHDPLAVCVAVTKTEMPEWLADALLTLLSDKPGLPKKLSLERLWAAKGRDALDAARAWWLVNARALPAGEGAPKRATWNQAAAIGEEMTRRRSSEVPWTSPGATKKSYRLVSKRLEKNPGRYYCPEDNKALTARILQAAARLK